MVEISHMLSAMSKRLDRDTFIWSPMSPSHLLGGLNQRIVQVSVKDCYRWMRFLGDEGGVLRMADMKTIGAFCYFAQPTSTELSEDSTETLPPGNYCWFSHDYPFIYPFKREQTLSCPEGRQVWGANTLRLSQDPTIRPLPELATTCVLTGVKATHALCESWIFPPSWAFRLERLNRPDAYEDRAKELFVRAENVVMIHRDLLTAFHENAIGVDVDGDCRIVVFHKITDVAIPSHLPCAGQLSEETKEFFRKHFLWSLTTYFLGGDVTVDASLGNVEVPKGGLNPPEGGESDNEDDSSDNEDGSSDNQDGSSGDEDGLDGDEDGLSADSKHTPAGGKRAASSNTQGTPAKRQRK